MPDHPATPLSSQEYWAALQTVLGNYSILTGEYARLIAGGDPSISEIGDLASNAESLQASFATIVPPSELKEVNHAYGQAFELTVEGLRRMETYMIDPDVDLLVEATTTMQQADEQLSRAKALQAGA
jgi:hypothetical protein